MIGAKARLADLARKVRTEVLLTAWQIGVYVPPDRHVLDEIILPYYARRDGFERVLFVGIKSYNAKNRELFRGRDYATIDPNSEFARHGGSPHVIDGLENVSRHFPHASRDVVIVNGVIGHGLNERELVERAIEGCRATLRPGGELVLGVNEETASSVDLRTIEALRRFDPLHFEPLGGTTHVVKTPLREKTHTFRFFRRRE
jgi:SAM-dependent methyltransferase